MKFEGVCIAVRDINKSRKFYEDIFGLRVYQDYGINISFGTLALQQEFDWLIDVAKDRIIERSHNMELYFEEDHFDAFIERLQQFDTIEYLGDGVKEATWGQRSIRFYDLDGHIIEVGENMTMVIQRFLDVGYSKEACAKRMDISLQDIETLLNN